MKKLKGKPLVAVEWHDAGQPIPRWQYLEGLEPARTVRCISVGFLLENGPVNTVIAPNLGSGFSDGEWDQASGLITIPTSCILKTRKLSVSAKS